MPNRDRFGPQDGATYTRLLRLCTVRDEASPRTPKTLLGMLRVGKGGSGANTLELADGISRVR